MNQKHLGTLALAWAGIFAFRFFLLPVRAPNVEPLLASLMPVGRHASVIVSVLFAMSSIVAYDAVTAGWGSWTWAAAGTYGLIAVAAHLYFRALPATRAHFVGFGIVATLAYDAVTGLAMGPLIFGQPFVLALAGQIPFTLLHLAGTVLFALTVSPLLDRALAVHPAGVPAHAPARA